LQQQEKETQRSKQQSSQLSKAIVDDACQYLQTLFDHSSVLNKEIDRFVLTFEGTHCRTTPEHLQSLDQTVGALAAACARCDSIASSSLSPARQQVDAGFAAVDAIIARRSSMEAARALQDGAARSHVAEVRKQHSQFVTEQKAVLQRQLDSDWSEWKTQYYEQYPYLRSYLPPPSVSASSSSSSISSEVTAANSEQDSKPKEAPPQLLPSSSSAASLSSAISSSSLSSPPSQPQPPPPRPTAFTPLLAGPDSNSDARAAALKRKSKLYGIDLA